METLANHAKEISAFKTIGHDIASLKENIERLNNQIQESATCECKDKYHVQVQSRSIYSIDQKPLPDHRRVVPRPLYQRPKRTVRCFWCDQLGHTYGNCMAYEKACSQQLALESEQKICDYQRQLPLRLNLGRGGMIDYFDQTKLSPKTKLQKQWKPKSHYEKSNVCQLQIMNTKIVTKSECLENDQNLLKPKSMSNIDIQTTSKDQDTLKKIKKEEYVRTKDDENEQSIDGNKDIHEVKTEPKVIENDNKCDKNKNDERIVQTSEDENLQIQLEHDKNMGKWVQEALWKIENNIKNSSKVKKKEKNFRE
ncbi:hypothetical protein KP509_08G026700 [Ceratopteris richardii]|uniref:Uncharacterized protein n=1 Tax=Ceratopteris richardii TaxID=49495 RepID=A0A8T2UBU8_CERRI|nr:hypothetical protein KP509_08G026700 [Ceratopteris richardii]